MRALRASPRALLRLRRAVAFRAGGRLGFVGRAEQHHHDGRVLAAVAVRLPEPLAGLVGDPLHALERRVQLLVELLPAALVELRLGAREVRVGPREATGGSCCRDRGADIAERRADHGVLDGRGRAGPRVVRDLRPAYGLVVVLDRTASRRALDELDETKSCELADVVADVAERRLELVGELTGAGGALVERRQDLDPQRMRQRLDDAGI